MLRVNPVVLGVDIGSKALGLALVTFEPPHRPVWADVVSIDRPDGGWAHQQVATALADVPSRAPAIRVEKCPRCEGHGEFWQNDGHGRQERVPCLGCHSSGKKRWTEATREITRVVIEDPPHVHGNVKTLKVLTAVATRVYDESLRRWGKQVDTVMWQTPSEWKKATVGKGNATKDEVRAWAMGRHDNGRSFDIPTLDMKQDAIDAIAIAVAGAKVELGQEAA